MKFCCAQCGQCCTNKWIIEVDGVSYKKLYQKFEELGRHKELYDNIQYHDVAPQIQFLPNGKCPYLTADNRCSIQLEIGEEYLLDICKIYPRHIFASQHAIEFALSLTCRTAVQTLLQEQIRIIETDWPAVEGQSSIFSFMQPNTITQYFPDKTFEGAPRLPYHVLEDCFIKLIQDRKYSVSQRLVGLGQFLDRLIAGKSLSDSEDTTNTLQSILSDSQCHCPEPNLEHHLKKLFLGSNRFLMKTHSVVWSRILRQILLSLSSGKQQPIETDIGRSKVPPPLPDDYQRNLDRYYRPTCSTVENILENYMVNFILSKNFYRQPIHIAYYRMAFSYAAVTAFALGYSILTDQMVSQQTMLQAIYDVENIFYSNWFYPFASALHAGKSYKQPIDCGIALANI